MASCGLSALGEVLAMGGFSGTPLLEGPTELDRPAEGPALSCVCACVSEMRTRRTNRQCHLTLLLLVELGVDGLSLFAWCLS